MTQTSGRVVRGIIVALLAILLTSTSALAQSPARSRILPADSGSPPPAGSARIAALVAASDADKELAENLTEVLVAAIAKESNAAGIVGQEEFRAQLGQSDRGVLGCLGDPPCLARVGRKLKVDLVLVAQVSRSVGSEFLVNANAIEVQSGKVKRTLLRRPRGQTKLIAVVRALAGDLMRAATATLRVEANVEADIYVDGKLVGRGRMMSIRDLSPGSHKVEARAAGMSTFDGDVDLAGDESRTLGVSLVALAQKGRPFYKTWWFWTAVGAAVVGGTAGGVYAATRPTEVPKANLGSVPFGLVLGRFGR